jgi:hypothetical protein
MHYDENLPIICSTTTKPMNIRLHAKTVVGPLIVHYKVSYGIIM